ncbi:extracellular solute-binding protein [Candidatus Microgenomates bacterium]|nr:extracellular solute-binding protein [Candidatus Microgenomates bacterium]
MDDDKVNLPQNQTDSEAPVPLAEDPPQAAPIPQVPPQPQPQPSAEVMPPPAVPEANPPPPPQPTSADQLVPEEVPADLTPAQVAPEQEFIPPTDSPTANSRTKYLVIGAAGLIFVVVFAVILGLLLGGRKTPKPVAANLLYWGLWDDPETMKPIIDEYTKKHPEIKIEYKKMDPVSYRDKLVNRKTNGPDIFRYHNTWLPELTDIAAPLPESVMSTAEFNSTFYKVHQNDLKLGSKYYGIPLMIDGLVLVYNDGLFKKAGINNPPTTWIDVYNYIGKLTVQNNDKKIITSGIALGTAGNIEHFSDIMALFLTQNGVDMKSLNSKEAAAALESYRKFAEEPGAFWDAGMQNSLNAFIQEKVAMIFVPSWEILAIKAANPQIRVKVAPVPQVPETNIVSISSYWAEGVSKFSKNQMQAWQFLKYLSEKDTMTKLYAEQSKTRLFGAAYSRKDLAPLLANQEYLAPVIKQATDGEYITMPMIARTFDNGLNDEIVKYMETAIDQTIQGVSYSQAMSTVAQGVTQVFAKYNIKVQ